jgi:hypothetical protein
MQSQRRFRRSLVIAGSSLALFGLFLANWKYPTIVTNSPRANLWIAEGAFLLPWMALAAAIYGFPRIWRWVAALMLLPLLLCSLVALLMNTLDLSDLPSDGSPPGFEERSRIRVPDGSDLVVYSVDCGATCSYDVMLRHEQSLIGPLLLVHVVILPKRGESMTPQLVDAHNVEVDGEQYRLMRHVAF